MKIVMCATFRVPSRQGGFGYSYPVEWKFVHDVRYNEWWAINHVDIFEGPYASVEEMLKQAMLMTEAVTLQMSKINTDAEDCAVAPDPETCRDNMRPFS